MPDFRFQISDFKDLGFRISFFICQNSVFGFQLADFRFRISYFIFQIPDFKFQIYDLRLRLSDFIFHNSDFRFHISGAIDQIPGFSFRISYFRFQVSDFRSHISDFIFHISDFDFRHPPEAGGTRLLRLGEPLGASRGNPAGPPPVPAFKLLYKNPLDKSS
jgi:hypothetical protein